MISEEGRGGIGIVRRARDLRLDREVAIKELQRDSHLARKRFEREMRITARLQHPGVVPVHEAGRWPDGSPFYTMKLVEGRSLKEIIAETRTLEQRIAILPHVLAVAETIAFAHSQRILHRDLKPSNVIIGGYGETVVIDWGLAKDLTEPESLEVDRGPYRVLPDQGLTVAGQVMGTPSYMPPEQARGEEVDERADIYAVGAILYHILAGGPPYRGGTSAEVLELLANRPPQALAQRVPGVPDDLAAIVEKAMHRDATQRYQSAALMVDDLRRFQTGQLVGAHNYTPGALVLRWIRQHRTFVAASIVTATAIALTAGVSFSRIVKARDRASAAERSATRERDLVILNRAEDVLSRDPTATIAWLKLLPRTANLREPIERLAREAMSRGVATSVRALNPHGLAQVQFSGDGSILAVSDVEGRVSIFKAATLDELASFSGSGPAPLLLDGKGEVLVTAQYDGRLVVWRSGYGTTEISAHHDMVFVGALSPDASVVATAGLDGDVRLTSLATKASAVLFAHNSTVRALAMSADGTQVASGSDSGTIAVANISSATPTVLLFHAESTAPIYDVDFAVGDRILTSQADGNVTIFGPTGTRLKTFVFDKNDVDHVRVSSDYRTAILCGGNGTITRIDVQSAEATRLSSSESRLTNSALSHGEGDDIFVASYADGSLRYWHLNSYANGYLRAHGGGVSAVAIDRATPSIASVALDGTLRLWKLNAPAARLAYSHQGAVFALAASPDGRWVATGGHDKRVNLLDLEGSLYHLGTHKELVHNLEFSADGAYFATGSWDQTIRLWSTSGRGEVARRDLPGVPGSLIVYGEREILVVVAQSIYRWDAERGTLTVLCKFGRDIEYIVEEDEESFIAVTKGRSLMRVSRVDGKAVRLATDVITLFPEGRALVRGSIAPVRSPATVVDYAGDGVAWPVSLPFQPVASHMDISDDVLYFFDAHGLGFRASPRGSMLMQGAGDTARVAWLADGRAMRITTDGSLESWNFEEAEVLVARPTTLTYAASLVLSQRGLVVMTSRAGEVWLLNLDVVQAAWQQQKTIALEQISDYRVTPIGLQLSDR
jgi:WD40 repeat protein